MKEYTYGWLTKDRDGKVIRWDSETPPVYVHPFWTHPETKGVVMPVNSFERQDFSNQPVKVLITTETNYKQPY